MEDHSEADFGDFSVEMGSFEMKQVRSFDRIFNLGEGGSFLQQPCFHNGIIYVGCLDKYVYAINAKTGKLVWKFRTEGGIGPASPVIHDGLIYVGSSDQNFYALDAVTGKMIWKFHAQDKIISCACAHDERVYFGSNDHNVYCVDAKTGRMIWKYQTQAEIAARPTYYEGKVFIGSYDRFMYCLDAENGKLIWKLETQGNVTNHPPLLVHDEKLYFPSFDNYLRVVDINTGKLVWKFLTGHFGGMNTGPTLHEDVLYQTNREGALYALTLDGKEKWNFRINNAMAHQFVYNDRIYVGAEDYNLYCLSLDGRVLWKFPTQGEIWWKSSAWENKIFFTSMDCYVYCVDIETHQLVWRFRGQGPVSYMGPPFDSFELKVSKHVETEDVGEKNIKRYDTQIAEDNEGNFYKSRITYQVSTQYAAKGKYQKDSDEEAF